MVPQINQNFLFKKVAVITGCDEDYENIVALLVSIFRDLKALSNLKNAEYKWLELIQQVLSNLNLDKNEVSRFQQKLLDLSSIEAKKLLTPLSEKVSADAITKLRAIRGILVLWHLDQGKRIPNVLLSQLTILFKAKNQEVISLIENLSLDIESLKLLDEFKPENKWFKFISSLIYSLQAKEKGPSLNHKTTRSDIPTFGQDVNLIDTANHSTAVVEAHNKIVVNDSSHKLNDLFYYNLQDLKNLYRKDFSGIPNSFSNCHPFELSQFIPGVVIHAVAQYDDTSFAYLLCLLFRCHVSRFSFIPLNEFSDKNLWLDLNDGFLVWNRQALIKSISGKDYVRIPLPIEIVQILKSKYSKHPNSKTLEDLFEDINTLKKQVRKYTFTHALSSHKHFITRLHDSYGRFVLYVCKDEVYAAVIAVDFSLGVTANLNYIVLETKRINEICGIVYKKLGFSGEFLNPVSVIVGSQQGQKIPEIIGLLTNQLTEAQISFSTIHNRSSLIELQTVHNQIVTSIVLLLAVTCGLRKARQYSICNHTLDLDNGLALINDKASTNYLSSRIIPIPTLTLEWLKFYKNWLKSFAKRLSNKSKRFSSEVSTICGDDCSIGAIPLLFYFHRDAIKPFGSKQLHLLIRNTGLESNLGRHFLDHILRDSLGSVLLNAHAGRANMGQESFGMRSALSVDGAMKGLRHEIDRKLENFNIPVPPYITAVRMIKQTLSKTYHPPLWDKPLHKQNSSDFDEGCPFHQLTLLNASNLEKLIAIWISGPVVKNIGEVAISMIMMDGLIHLEEVIYGVKELLLGNIYKLDQEYFVDINSPNLGIRRIFLSSVTLCIFNSTNSSGTSTSDAELLLQIEASASQLLKKIGIKEKNSSTHLSQMAEDFYALRVPGVLREWMCGRQHGRTLRPETLTRHRLNLKEHLSNLGLSTHRARSIRSDLLITKALNDACDQETNKDSNLLRMNKLAVSLQSLAGMFLRLSENVLTQYALFLSTQCPAIKSPNSVRTHFYVVKPLIQKVCEDFEDMEELSSLDWYEISTNFLLDAQDEGKISALNYLLRLFNQSEIKSLTKDEARASRTYLDFPSAFEIDAAIQLIIDNKSFSEHQKLSGLMLNIMANIPLRAEDVVSLRVSDVFIGEHSFVVITSQATGTKKSQNANRVLFINDRELIYKLSMLQTLRRSIASHRPERTSLFGSSEDPTSFAGTEELLSIVRDALKCSSGSSFVRPHSLRTKYLTEQYGIALLPSDDVLDSLHQRNLLYELSVSAGHADPDISVKNYVCGLDRIRRTWVDKLIHQTYKPSAHFYASITSVRYDTWRKRLQRNFPINGLQLIFEDEAQPQLLGRVKDLLQTHQLSEFQYELNSNKGFVNHEVSTAQYLAFLFLGMDRDAAGLYANISDSKITSIDKQIDTFCAHKGSQFFSKLRIDYKHFKVNDVFIRFTQHFGSWDIDPIQSAQLLRLIPAQLEKPCVIAISDISFILNFIVPRLQSVGFILKVLIPDKSLHDTKDFIESLHRMGVRRVEKMGRRNFTSAKHLLAMFCNPNEASGKVQQQIISNFEINIFILAFLTIKNGNKNEQ